MVQASSSVRLLLLAVVATVVLCASVVRADDHPLKCDPGLAGNYMVTRLWRTVGSMSPVDVVAEFNNNFAPIVRDIPGFVEYVGTPVNSTHAFFFNIMATQAAADSAQAAAQTFQKTGVLANEIVPEVFTEGGTIGFHKSIVTVTTCTDAAAKNTGKNLATRLWNVRTEDGVTGAKVVQEFLNGFAPTIQQATGFIEYGGVSYDALPTLAFFWNVFDTASGAASANSQAATFKAGNTMLAGNITKNVFTESVITFDYVEPTHGDGLLLIIIIAGGALVLLIVVIIVIVCCCCKSKGQTEDQFHGVDAVATPNPVMAAKSNTEGDSAA